MTDEAMLPGTCPNCGNRLDQNYCPNCGQERTSTIVPLGHLLHDVVEEFFLLDSKLFRTLKPLITRPGFLTNEYIAGRRVRYLSPFRLYFIISAIYFLAFSFAHYDVEVMHSLAYGLEQAHHAHAGGASGPSSMSSMHTTGSMMHGMHMAGATPAVSDRERRHQRAVAQTSMWFLMNQSKLTFLLVPIAALLLKLLYFTTRRLYIEHLVFAVHVQSFLFAVLLPTLLPFGRSVTYLLALGCSAVYLFLAMRAVYRQCIASTAVRCGVMLASYLIIMAGAAYAAFLVFYAQA
jgi:hypothetical protein